MKSNTFRKYFIATSSVFLLCITFIVVILSFLMNNYLSKDKFQSLSVSCDAVSDYFSYEYDSFGFKRNIYNISSAISASQNQTVIIVIDKNQKVISCTCKEYSAMGECRHTKNKPSNDFLSRTHSGQVNEITRLSKTFSELNYVTAQQVRSYSDNSVVGYVLTASKASSLTRFYSDLIKIYFFSAIVPIVVMFFVLYAVTRRLNKPLKLMSEAAMSMAKGDFSKRIPVTSNDEIGMLAESFNQMTNSLVELENMRRGFIANVSHELRTPMTTIGGFIDGIIDGTIDESQQEYYLKIVSKEVKRLSRLVQGMLSLSKLEAGETQINPTDFDLGKMILDIVINQEQRIESKNLNITGLEELENYRIFADKDLLHQVIYNLCDNAIKFTNDGGTIDFSLKRVGNMIDFRVRNTGKGIPEKDLPFVFDRFYKGDKARSQNKESTGLGLFLVKTIVKLHKGTAFVTSKENVYTEFGVSLPVEII